MNILWLKALHVFFMVAWMAGIFYLPRIFVYFAEAQHEETRATFKVMQRRLWFFILPFAVLTAVFGIWMISTYGKAWFVASTWLHLKLVLMLALYIYYVYLYRIMRQLERDENIRSSRYYRILNELPVLILLATCILAIVKPVLW